MCSVWTKVTVFDQLAQELLGLNAQEAFEAEKVSQLSFDVKRVKQRANLQNRFGLEYDVGIRAERLEDDTDGTPVFSLTAFSLSPLGRKKARSSGS